MDVIPSEVGGLNFYESMNTFWINTYSLYEIGLAMKGEDGSLLPFEPSVT